MSRVYPQFSDEDAWLHDWPWSNSDGYAMATFWIAGRFHSIKAHRAVMECSTGRILDRREIVDHIDRDPLNNRRDNLRLVNHRGNAQNRTLNHNSTTGHRGVSKSGRRFKAYVHNDRSQIYLGSFDTPELAAKVAADARRELGFLGD